LQEQLGPKVAGLGGTQKLAVGPILGGGEATGNKTTNQAKDDLVYTLSEKNV